MTTAHALFLPRDGTQALIDALRGAGWRCVGPQVRDHAIVYDDVDDARRLPWGIRVDQAPGSYRLREGDPQRAFDWANGPQCVKPFAFAPQEVLWRADRRADGSLAFRAQKTDAPRIAVIGVRACDLAALALQDQHFLQGRYADAHYAARRAALLLVAVDCARPAATCFCASTGDGPVAGTGFDIALAEIDGGFVLRGGTRAGTVILDRLALAPATQAQADAAAAQGAEAARIQQRRLPGTNLRDTLFARLDHARWDDVAARCLACGNCTQVCPTCFCHSESDASEPGGRTSVHARQWDSCFTPGHAYMHGYAVRGDVRSRYRQWLTHKLGGWHDQYGRSGCVGCGRCIAWCPVGIDITEEAQALCAP
ncbi:MAG: 4Fe-4S dicluster domain-containing protein [Gammaproteobacteria bacterium]